MSTYEDVTKDLSHFTHARSDGPAKVHDMLRGWWSHELKKITTDAMASDTIAIHANASTGLGFGSIYVPYAIVVTGAVLMPNAALTAGDTNYATLTVKYDDGAAGTPVDIASIDTQAASANWVAGTAKTMTLATTGGVAVAAGKYIGVVKAVTMSGKAIVPCTIILTGKYA